MQVLLCGSGGGAPSAWPSPCCTSPGGRVGAGPSASCVFVKPSDSFQERIFHYLRGSISILGSWLCSKLPPSQRKQGDYARSMSLWCACACVCMWCLCTRMSVLAGSLAPFPMSPGEGNGNPLQCSCLENLRDGGAWWAAVYGVGQSRTRLK